MELLAAQIIILIFSIVLHEISHGVVAYSLGDPTAKNAGRLTLNPLPHIDPIGSLALPLFLIVLSQLSGGGGIILGWARPVPINPANFRGDPAKGAMKVGFAGPASNFALAIAFGLLLRFLPLDAFPNPTFPLLIGYIVYLNILLGVFNLLPIPPLDGSHLLFSVLPRSMNALRMFLAQYGFLFLLFFIFFFFPVIFFVVNSVFKLIVGFSLY